MSQYQLLLLVTHIITLTIGTGAGEYDPDHKKRSKSENTPEITISGRYHDPYFDELNKPKRSLAGASQSHKQSNGPFVMPPKRPNIETMRKGTLYILLTSTLSCQYNNSKELHYFII